jgi:hypothetical protein
MTRPIPKLLRLLDRPKAAIRLLAPLALILLLAVPATAAQAQKKAPKMYWGAWIGDQITGTAPPWDMGAVASFEARAGKGLSLIELASPFASCAPPPHCAPIPFPVPVMENIRAYGAIPFFSWSTQTTPWDSANPDANGQNIRLANVINGSYDGYIREFATAAAAWGHPFFLRLNWEMNGNWFPWAESANGNAPGEFVAAWRHIHDIFTSVGATNATWTWCPFADQPRKLGNLRAMYPGSRYVDWTCLDGYNWGDSPANPHPWRSFDEIFAPAYERVSKRIAPKKPMILGELASGSSGGNKAAWIRAMMSDLPKKYPNVRGLIWFDAVDREIDWPLETSAKSMRAFATALRRPTFMANRYSTLASRPITPP